MEVGACGRDCSLHGSQEAARGRGKERERGTGRGREKQTDTDRKGPGTRHPQEPSPCDLLLPSRPHPLKFLALPKMISPAGDQGFNNEPFGGTYPI